MRRPINYYYYYYGGSLNPNKKEVDINQIIRFLSDSSELIYSLVLNEQLNKGFYKSFNEENRTVLNLKDWVEDVKTLINLEIRDLKLTILTKESINETWAKLDTIGLTGIQLQSKLVIWFSLFDKIISKIKEGLENISQAFVKDLKNATKATNIILQSLVKALPGFEPLVELKDFFELSLEIE